MEGDGHGKRPSSSAASSRLSPLAQPFSLNAFTRQPPWSSLTSVDPSGSMLDSWSNFNLEDDHELKITTGDVFLHNLLDFGEDSDFTKYPSANADSEFGFMASTSYESLPNYTELPSYGHSQTGFSKNASFPYETLLEQGKPAGKGSKPYGENSENEKRCDLTIGKVNQFISRSTDQVDTGFFSFSAVNSMDIPDEFSMPDTSSTSMLQNSSQTQVPCTAPALTWSRCNSKISLCESGTRFGPYTAKSMVFHSPKHNAFPSLVPQSLDPGTTISSLNPVLSKNVDFTGNSAVNNVDSSSKWSPGVKYPHHQIYDAVKEIINHDERPNDKGKEGKDGKSLSGMAPLLTEKSDPLSTLTNISDDFRLEHRAAKETASLARNLDENDPDLDSPCWKGTLASRQSPFGVLRSLSSDFVENEQEARNSLNPLAPHFFPRHTKAIVNYHANDFGGDNFSTFQKSESAVFNSFCKGQGPVDQAEVKSSLSINGIGTKSSTDNHELERVQDLLNNSENGSVVKSPEGLSKLLSTHSKTDGSFSKGHGPVGQAGSKSSFSINGVGTQSSNAIHEVGRVYPLLSTSESGFVLDSPEGLSKLLSTLSKRDVPTILNVMHDLSELLVQNFSDDLYSLNEHNHDLIQHIINNLSMCIQHRAGRKTPISDLSLSSTPYSPDRSTELHKRSNMGFQLTKTNALGVPYELDYQTGHEGRKVNSHVFTERMLGSFSSCSGIGTQKSNDIIQVMGNSLRDNHLTNEELDPQALVYKKLWLEAEAELCSMKYETCVLSMQLEMGGRKLDKNKVSGKLLARELH